MASVPTSLLCSVVAHLTPVVGNVDSAIHWVNHYPAYNAIGLRNTFPLGSDLSGGLRYPTFEQREPGLYFSNQKAG